MTKIDRFLGYVFPIFSALTVLFFIPMWSAVDISKTYYFIFGTAIIALMFLVSKIYDRSLMVVNKKIGYFALLFLLLILTSSVFAPVPWLALFGRVFEMSTFGFIFFAVIFLILGIYCFSSIENTMRYLKSLFAVFIPVVVFQMCLILWPSIFSINTFLSKTNSVVGTWHDLGMLSLIFLFVTLYVLLYKKVSKNKRIVIVLILAGSLLFLFLVNLSYLYVVGLLISGTLAVLSAMRHEGKLSKYVLPLSVGILLIVGLLLHGRMNVFLLKQGITYSEIKPAFDSTATVFKKTIASRPFLGAGPNHFSAGWLKYKPAVINTSTLWTTPFNSGYSTFTTFAVNYGPITMLGILLSIVAYLILTLRAIPHLSKKGNVNGELFYTRLFFVVSLIYLLLFFTQNIGVVGLMMLLTSIAIVLGHLHYYGVLHFKAVHLDGGLSKKLKIVRISSVIIIAGTILSLGIIGGSKAYAYTLAQRADKLSVTNIDGALLLFSQAYKIDKNDLYARVISQIYFNKVNQINATEVTDDNREILQTYFKNAFDQAVQAGQVAFKRNPIDLDNMANLLTIYRSVIPVVKEAYPESLKLLDEAFLVSPNNPTLYLFRSRIEFDNGNIEEAKKFANLAIENKNNYADAYVFLSSIALSEKDTAQSKKYLERAVLSDNTNLGALAEYGMLLLNEKKYQNAGQIFVQMLSINPELHQVRFYLAVALDQLGQTEDAIKQLEILQTYLPENKEIADKIEQLNNGIPLSPVTSTEQIVEEPATEKPATP